MSTYTLHALDYTNAGMDVAPLTAALGSAVVAMASVPTTAGRDDHAATEHLYTLDAAIMRNTTAHGMGYRHGFLVHTS